MPAPQIEIVSATRLSEADFAAKSALGRSLARLKSDARIVPRIAFSNSQGLPDIYNAAIADTAGADIVVFMHDDVWIDEEQFAERVIEGLDVFDVIGVAGNRRDARDQFSWLLIDGKWDKAENLSGGIAHGEEAGGEIDHFGPFPAPCQLLDGVFLATSKSTLATAGLSFDPQFRFHFYDLDFCRNARQKALTLGTWGIALTHQSPGDFASPEWVQSRESFLKKWDGGRP